MYFVNFVNGAQGILTNVDFSEANPRAFILGDGDGISFSIDEIEYIISVDELGESSVRLKSFFDDGNGEREVFYIPLNKIYSYRLDFNKDDFYDIKVSLVRMEDDGRAVILFERINEKRGSNNEVTSEVNRNFDWKGITVSALIILAGLIAYFTFRKK